MLAQSPLLVAIAGGTGSGKTTLTKRLADALGHGVVVIEHDWYYLDRAHLSAEERKHVNYDEPAALDNALLIEHLSELRQGRTVAAPQYDFSTHTRAARGRDVHPAPVVIVEGILVLAIPELAAAFDLAIFVDTAPDVRLLRRIRRDLVERGRSLDSVEEQYVETVRPMHLLHVEPSRTRAHLIVPEGGENAQAIDVIVGRLKYLLLGATRGG
jgi:uridine kinase